MPRAALFAMTGVAFFVYWYVADPSFVVSARQSEWSFVLFFSGVLLTLGVALPVFGRMIGGRWVTRLSLAAGSGVALSSIANIFEDGLKIEWVFFLFILGEMILLVALLLMGSVIAATSHGRYRLLALVPFVSVAGILLFVIAGGPLMLITWVGAAGAALALSSHKSDAQDLAAIS
jgi:hypothetical protein